MADPGKPVDRLPGGAVLQRGDGQKVQFVEVVPLHDAEMELVKSKGLAALMEHFDVEFAADPTRRSVV